MYVKIKNKKGKSRKTTLEEVRFIHPCPKCGKKRKFTFSKIAEIIEDMDFFEGSNVWVCASCYSKTESDEQAKRKTPTGGNQ